MDYYCLKKEKKQLEKIVGQSKTTTTSSRGTTSFSLSLSLKFSGISRAHKKKKWKIIEIEIDDAFTFTLRMDCQLHSINLRCETSIIQILYIVVSSWEEAIETTTTEIEDETTLSSNKRYLGDGEGQRLEKYHTTYSYMKQQIM